MFCCIRRFFVCLWCKKGEKKMEMKSEIRLSPEILEECLGDESCFDTIKHERDITLTLNSIEFKNAKYIGNNFILFFLSMMLFLFTFNEIRSFG